MWLKVRIIGAIAICVAIPLLSGYTTVALTSQVAFKSAAESELQAATKSTAAQLERRLAQNYAHLRAWATLPVMQSVLIADDGGEIARAIANFKHIYGDFASLTVTDARGAVVASTAQTERSGTLSGDEGFREAASGRPFQSAYGFRSSSAPETIWFTVPVIANYDRQTVVGTVTGVIDFNTVAKGVFAHSALAAIDSRNMVIEGARDRRIAFSSRIDANLLEALAGVQNRDDGVDDIVWKDEPYFVARAALAGKSLLRNPGLVVRGIAPGAAVFAGANTLTAVFGVVACLTGILALVLARRWSRPFTRLAKAMDRLARGDALSPIPTVPAHETFGQMARAIEIFRQTKIVRDRLAARELELHHAKEEAEAAALAKAQHLAGLSRELRTQLNSIVGLSELINSETLRAAGGGDSAGYARDISRAGIQLLAVINDLFDLSEAEAGQSRLEETEADLDTVVRDSVEMMREAASRARIALSFEGCEAPVTVRIDAHKMRQILFNLLSNAVKFTAEEGRVHVRATVVTDGRPTIVVSDDGIGMPANLTPIALTPFTATGEATPHGRHGAGLGLPLVRRLVELHHGSVEIESETDKGTTVTVALPASRVVARGTQSEESAEHHPQAESAEPALAMAG